MLDVVRGYPDVASVFIGFFMVDAHIRELVWVAVSFRVYAILCVLRDIIACVLVTLMEMLNRKVFGRGAVYDFG